MMIGLKYIAEVFEVTYTDIAEEMGINPQNIYDWMNFKDGKPKRKIPQKRLEELSYLFELPSDYFLKELNRQEQLYVHLSYRRLSNDGELDYENDEVRALRQEYQIESMLVNVKNILSMEDEKDKKMLPSYTSILNVLNAFCRYGLEKKLDVVNILAMLLFNEKVQNNLQISNDLAEVMLKNGIIKELSDNYEFKNKE